MDGEPVSAAFAVPIADVLYVVIPQLNLIGTQKRFYRHLFNRLAAL